MNPARRLCAGLLAFVAVAATAANPVAERLARGEVNALRTEMTDSQRTAVLNTFLGREDLNAGLQGLPAGARSCAREGLQTRSAVGWLERHAAQSRVLMFNESHYLPQARVFVRQVLPQLRRIGFTHIGFETLQPAGGGTRALGPLDGYYSIEPTFAALIRDANALGFTVFAYEADGQALANLPIEQRMAAREDGEARNLAKIVDEAPASARFIVFAGWSHIAETPLRGFDPAGDRWMANRFAAMTGIDPLTIDLTTCALEAPSVDARLGRVLVGADGAARVEGEYAGAVDAQFALPLAARDDPRRAGFFRRSLGRAVRVPAALHPPDTEVLVEARPIAAAPNDLAFDRVLLRAGEDLPLYLPRGAFRLTSWTTDGRRIGAARVRAR